MKARVKETGKEFKVRGILTPTADAYAIEEVELFFDESDQVELLYREDYWERLRHEYAGMATADRKWYDIEKRLPIPTDGDDFLVKIENCEEHYAYAWYAYDRQCFMCYATGLSLGTAVRYYKPIIEPM